MSLRDSIFDVDDNKTYYTFRMRTGNKTVEVSFDDQDISLDKLLEEFLQFVKACDYHFEIDDRLDVVNDFRDSPSDLRNKVTVSIENNQPIQEDLFNDHVNGTNYSDFDTMVSNTNFNINYKIKDY